MPTAKTKTTKTSAAVAARSITTKAKPKKREPVLGDHPDTFGIIERAMRSGARKAVEENDRLGIPTPGAKDGKIVFRQPPKKRGGHTPDTV